MIEAIFFDIDGTLLSFQTHKMTKTLEQALIEVRKKGIKLFIATGRHVSEMEEINQYPLFDGYITLNGCYCYNENGAYFKQPIDAKDAAKTLEIASEMKYCIAIVDEKEMTINFHNDLLMQTTQYANVPVPPIQDPLTLKGRELYQLVFYTHPHEDELLLSQLPTLSAQRWHPAFVDVTPSHISKKNGILETCRVYGFHPENCMAFGDAGNDIEMLKAVGIGVAMGNASQDVKEAANETTLSVDEDGIVHTFKKYNLL